VSHAFGKASTRTSSTGNPITTASFTVERGETILVLLLKVNGGTNRAGGAPSWNGMTMTQADTVQKAATSPEANCELWYLLNMQPAAATCTIPNTGGLTVFYTLATARDLSGKSAQFLEAKGNNGTSTNPNPGTHSTWPAGTIAFAVCCSGATDFDPATPAGTGFGTGTGTPLGTFDDGAHGGGQQYLESTAVGNYTLLWSFGTSDDWGAISAMFGDVPMFTLENYQSVKVIGSGMKVTETLR